jgi:hypothetical protein
MKCAATIYLRTAALLTLLSRVACAQLEVTTTEQPVIAFGGADAVIPVLLRNAGEQTVNARMKVTIFQLSASMRMPVSTQDWKNVSVLGRQTLLERAVIKFPAVRAATQFELRWLDNHAPVGQNIVSILPTNMLKNLADIGGKNSFGVFDPNEYVMPLLRTLKLEFDDLNEGQRIETWRGRLALVGPPTSAQGEARLLKIATILAERGAGVVLLSTKLAPGIRSSAVLVQCTWSGRIIGAPSEWIAGIPTNAAAQLALLQLAKLAVHTNWLATETN